jgi:peptidoglycan/LPS O-acetylase OafA/YrhL
MLARVVSDPIPNRADGEGIKAMKGRLAYLDSYRGAACLMVYLYHTAVNITFFGVPFYGHNGVLLFFVLSGYLMSGKFLPALLGHEPLSGVGNYVLSRVSRIYPPYLIALAVFVVLRVVTGTNVPTWQNVLLRMGLIFNYFDRYDYFAINASFWSLAIEMQFYFILPLVVWLTMRCSRAGRSRAVGFACIFLVVGIASRAFETSYVDHGNPHAIAQIRIKWASSHLDLFGAGILLRVIEHWIHSGKLLVGWAGGIVGIISGVSILAITALWTSRAGHWQDSKSLLFTALGPTLTCFGFAMLLGATGLSPLAGSRLFHWPGLVWLGQISYSFYLYHVGVLFAFNRIFKPENWGMSWDSMTVLIGLCSLPATVLVAWMGYWSVERPFHRSVGQRTLSLEGLAFRKQQTKS